MSKLLKLFLAVIILAGCSKQDETQTPADYNLAVVSADGKTTDFIVENAVTPEELQTGLMNRDKLEEGHGMIFNLKGYEHIAMWMKDTQIPLDMVFVNDGKVVWLYENAEPNSTKIIVSPVPANAVIELNAGDIKKFNIKEGDTVKHAFFDNTAAEEEPQSEVVEEETITETAPEVENLSTGGSAE